jgi:hypothetical protein
MCTCLECGKSIVSGDLCKFCKCFTKSSLVNYHANKEAMSMTKEQMSARIRFQEIAIKDGGYTIDEVANMDLLELRDLVDELRPTVIVNSSLTVRGGKTKRVTVLKSKAA